jgi:hypothetical protein
MSLVVNGVNITNVVANNTSINKVYTNGTMVWTRDYNATASSGIKNLWQTSINGFLLDVATPIRTYSQYESWIEEYYWGWIMFYGNDGNNLIFPLAKNSTSSSRCMGIKLKAGYKVRFSMSMYNYVYDFMSGATTSFSATTELNGSDLTSEYIWYGTGGSVAMHKYNGGIWWRSLNTSGNYSMNIVIDELVTNYSCPNGGTLSGTQCIFN